LPLAAGGPTAGHAARRSPHGASSRPTACVARGVSARQLEEITLPLERVHSRSLVPRGARRDWLFEAGSSLRDSRASSAPRERRAVRSLSRFSFPSGGGPSVGGSDRNRVGPLRGSTRCRSLGLFPGTAGAVRRTATTGQTTPGWNAAETYPSPSRRAGTVAEEGPPSGWWSPTGKPREKRAMPAGGERQRWTLAQGGRSAAGNSPNRKFSSLRSPPSLPKTGRIGERRSRVGCL